MQNNTESELNDLHDANKEENLDAQKQEVNEEWEKQSQKEKSSEDDLATKYAELEDQYKRLWADQQNMINRFNREK